MKDEKLKTKMGNVTAFPSVCKAVADLSLIISARIGRSQSAYLFCFQCAHPDLF